MGYKLLALDVDGTLLRRDGAVHPEDRAAIARLRASGVPVTLCTGRLFSGTRGVAHQVGLEGPMACVDGAHIVDLHSEKTLFARTLAGPDAAALREALHPREVATFVFARDAIVHDERGLPFAPYVRTWSPSLDAVERVTEHHCWEHHDGVQCAVVVGPEGEVLGAAEHLREALAHKAFVVTFALGRFEGLHAMLVRAGGLSKGTAIEWLAAHHGIGTEEVVVVGDWINDVPMFQTAGRSYVMAQAPAEVKAAATEVLSHNAGEGGGVAEAIERAWGL